MKAVDKFPSENDKFVVDQSCERSLMTLHSRGSVIDQGVPWTELAANDEAIGEA